VTLSKFCKFSLFPGVLTFRMSLHAISVGRLGTLQYSS
jgi:hypothetical protein